MAIPFNPNKGLAFGCPVLGCSTVFSGNVASGSLRGPGDIREHIKKNHPTETAKDIIYRVCMVRLDLSAAFIVTHHGYWKQCKGYALWTLPEHTLETNYMYPPGPGSGPKQHNGRKRPRTRQSYDEEIDLQNQAGPSTAAASTAMIQAPTAPTTNTISDPAVQSFIEAQAAQGRGVIFSHTNTSLEIKPRI